MTNSGIFPEFPPGADDGTININKVIETVAGTIKAPRVREFKIGKYRLILVKSGQINFKENK